MTRKYFGTDGIRGTVGQSPITPDFVLRLAHAVGHVLRKTGKAVLIGKDTRISGYMLESALESGFNSAGVDIGFAGAVAYARRGLPDTRAARQSRRGDQCQPQSFCGNGIKFFSAQGTKLNDEWEFAVEATPARAAGLGRFGFIRKNAPP